MTWTIQYYNGSAWVNQASTVIDQAIDELNGQLELDFIIPNTSSNLTFVQSNQQIQLLWGGTVVFSGLLMAYKATFTQIECTVYNNTFEVMKKRQITGQYNNVAANTVLAAICAACGLTAGSCPTTTVSLQFNSTDCFTAVSNLANQLNLNVYNSGSTVIIGTKGNQTPTSLIVDTQSSISSDRSKSGYDGVIIRGVNQYGQTITGSAGNTGSGYNVKVLSNKVALSQAALNALAFAYLQSLQQTNSGCPLECDISQAAALNSGDLVTISNGGDLGLSGNYAIYRITKNLTKATVEIVRPAGAFLNLIAASSNLANALGGLANSAQSLNTLPIGSDQSTPYGYLTLVDSNQDVATLTLGVSSGTFLGQNINATYIIPSISSPGGTPVTINIAPSGPAVDVPALGLGTYNYPFLFTDSVYVFTDFLNSLRSSPACITFLAPPKLYSSTAGGVKLYDATGTAGSNGQFLQINSSGLPVWTSFTPSAWNGGTVGLATTFNYTLSENFNSQTVPAAVNGLTLIWNFSGSLGEADFWDAYVYSGTTAGHGGFRWYQLTGTGTYKYLANLDANGNFTINGTSGVNTSLIVNGGSSADLYLESATGYERIFFDYGGSMMYCVGYYNGTVGGYTNSLIFWNTSSAVTMAVDQSGNLTTAGYHQIGTRGGGANGSGYPQIFCRTDTVPGCTIQLGASGQRFDIVDYGWTVDLLILDQAGNMSVSNSVASPHFFLSGSGGEISAWSATHGSFTSANGITSNGDINCGGNLWMSGSILFNASASNSDFVYLVWVNSDVLGLLCDNDYQHFNVSYTWNSRTYYLGALDCGAVFTAYVNPIAGFSYVSVDGTLFGTTASATSPYSSIGFASNYGNPVSGRLIFGDGTGWQFRMARGTFANPIDTIIFYDTGEIACGMISANGNVFPSASNTYYCGTSGNYWLSVDTNYLYCNVLNGLSGSGITIYGGSGSCGTSSSYWNYVYSAYIYYIHAPSAFNELLHDEFNEKINFDLVRNIKLKGGTVDPDCIKHLKNKDGFYESSTMDGWHLCVQQLIVKKLDEQEIVNDELREELDKAKSEIDALRLRLDELTQKIGGE